MGEEEGGGEERARGEAGEEDARMVEEGEGEG